VKRITWFILGILILLAWMCAPTAAQDESGVTLSISVGFDGYCRADAWCPVYVVLSNEGADVEGELQAFEGDGESGVYVKRVTLPARSRKAYFLSLPLYDLASRPEVTVELLEGKKTVVLRRATASLLDEGERLYGIVSSSPSEFNFLSTVAPAGGQARVAQLDLESLPPDPLAWEGLDVLVLNDVVTTALDEEQRQALETWVAHGGHLVVGGGAGAAGTAAGLDGLLPVSVGGTRSVEDLWALGDLLGAYVAPGPYAIAEVTLRDGEALVEQEGAVLVARRAYGEGSVSFLAFDAGMNPFVDWDDNVRLWKWVLEESSGRQRLVIRDGYYAREAVSTIPGLESPSILHILGFLLVYTILIGPVNYVVLRKLDRRELAWVTIPLLVLGFSACAYVTGFQMRGFKPILHRLALVYVPQGSQVGRVSQLVGLFSPQRTNYDVWVPGTEVRSLPEDYYGGSPGRSLRILEGADGVTVADLRVDVGGIEPFVAEGYVDVPGVDADLRLLRTASTLRLEGTVRNGQVVLEDAVLIAGSRIERLGDVAAGEEIDVSVPFHSGTLVTYALPEQILGTTGYWDDTLLSRRYMFLGAIFNPYYGPYGGSGGPVETSLDSGVYLIGWSDEDVPLSAEVMGRPYSAVETALYIYVLPVTEKEVSAGSDIPSDLIMREWIDAVGYVEEIADGFHMSMGSEITFRFTIWPGLTVREADKLVLDMRQSYTYAIPPVVSIWDLEGESWRRLDIGWGQHEIPNAKRYVSSSGRVLLRLEATETVTVADVTLAIKGQ